MKKKKIAKIVELKSKDQKCDKMDHKQVDILVAFSEELHKIDDMIPEYLKRINRSEK